jgi:hypothetical protein
VLCSSIWSCVSCTRFVSCSAKFGIYSVLSLIGTLVEAKMFTFTLECTHFIFNKCPIQAHDGANAKCSPRLDETDYSVGIYNPVLCVYLMFKLLNQ